jgi:hypothetical protein
MPGMKFNPEGYKPRDLAKEGYINKGQSIWPGFTRWEKPESTTPASSIPQVPQASVSSGSPMPVYVDGQQPMAQQQQVQPTSMPRATTGRFSFNQGNFRIGDSTMNSSDTGLNI